MSDPIWDPFCDPIWDAENNETRSVYYSVTTRLPVGKVDFYSQVAKPFECTLPTPTHPACRTNPERETPASTHPLWDPVWDPKIVPNWGVRSESPTATATAELPGRTVAGICKSSVVSSCASQVQTVRPVTRETATLGFGA